MKREKSCGCIIFNNSEQVLLIKMTAGHWSFPKGHIEGTETERNTAYREVLEETGLTCKILDGFRYITTYSPFAGTIKDVVYFVAKPTSNYIEIQHEELSEARYFNIDDAVNRITFKSDLDVLNNAVAFMGYRQ